MRDILKCLSDLKASQDTLNAVVTFYDEDNVLKQAQDSKGKLLDGLPIVLKDNISTKDVLTTASSKILSNYIPVYDATLVTKLKDAGAIILAKTAMDELAMGGTGLTPCTGKTHNPYNPSRISGGSSSGSAALVGAHLVEVAIGSDTGDSVRKPASYCGAVGFKPTYGRISRYGVIPYASSLDHVGLFSTSVKQLGPLMSVLSGRDDKDLTSLDLPKEEFNIETINLKDKKIGLIKELMENKKGPLYERFNLLIEQLKSHGAQIVEISLNKKLLEQLFPVYYIVANCEAIANHANLDGIRFGKQVLGETYQDIMINTRTKGFGELLKRRLVIGAYGLDDIHQEKIFRKAQKIRRLIVEDYKKAFDQVDVVLTLASDQVAPSVENLNKKLSVDEMIAENHLVLDNFSGYPSITIPLDFVDGLPFGINLSAYKAQDKMLLDVAVTFEKLIDFESKNQEVNPWIIK